MQFSSKYITRVAQAATTAPLAPAFGLVEFLGKTPIYTSFLYDMYQYCRIRRVDMKFKFTNTGTTPVTCAIGAYPFNQINTSSTTPEQFEVAPRAIWKLAGISTGDSTITLDRSFDVEQTTGVPFFDKAHWIDFTRALLTTPADPHELALYVSLANSGVTSWQGYWDLQLTYHMQWFSPMVAGGPQALTTFSVHPRQTVESEEEDEEDERYSYASKSRNKTLNPRAEEFHLVKRKGKNLDRTTNV